MAKEKEMPKIHLVHKLVHTGYLDGSDRRRVEEMRGVYVNFASEMHIEARMNRNPIQSGKDLDQVFRAIVSVTYQRVIGLGVG